MKRLVICSIAGIYPQCAICDAAQLHEETDHCYCNADDEEGPSGGCVEVPDHG